MVQHEREEMYAALQYAASFHCLVEEWKDCEKLKPSQRIVGLCEQKSGSKDASHGVVCAAYTYRCIRLGRSSDKTLRYKEHVKNQSGYGEDSKHKLNSWGNWEDTTW